MFWNRKLKKVEAERDRLRAENERLIEGIKRARDGFHCAAYNAKVELERAKKELATAEARAERWEELCEKVTIEHMYVCEVAKRHGINPYGDEEV